MWRHSDATIEELQLDSLGYVPWWDEEVPRFNVMVHRLSDATRHAGHADILREALDGSTGDDPDSAPPPGLEESWRTRVETIERAARAVSDARSGIVRRPCRISEEAERVGEHLFGVDVETP